MKIGIIAKDSLDNKKLWSGTIYNLSKFVKQSYEVVPIIIKDSLVKKCLLRGMKIVFRNKRTILTTILDKAVLSKEIKKAIEDGVNIFLGMAVSDLIASNGIPKECKLIYLSDATYHAMFNYYFFDNKHDQKIGNQIEQRAINRADSIIYASEWAKADAINYYNAKKEKITVMPFPSYIDDYYKKKSNLNMKTSIHLLFVGVEWERKGTDIAIDCVEYLNEIQNNILFDLTIIGLSKPKNKNYKSYIKFKGKLYKDNLEEYEELIRYYQNSDVFLLPTKAECAGIVFSEASMYGLPIFTHNTGGIGTYVKDGYNGMKLKLGSDGKDFGQAILSMIQDKKLQEYSDNSRNYYKENLSVEVWKKSFEEILTKISKN